MTLPWQNVEGFAGIAGVGALALLGIFLILDGRVPELFPTIEFYAKTATLYCPPKTRPQKKVDVE